MLAKFRDSKRFTVSLGDTLRWTRGSCLINKSMSNLAYALCHLEFRTDISTARVQQCNDIDKRFDLAPAPLCKLFFSLDVKRTGLA
jgi:hypothetical protein